MSEKHISRRGLLGTSAAVAAFTIVPRHVLGGAGQTAPSAKLSIAGIGAKNISPWPGDRVFVMVGDR